MAVPFPLFFFSEGLGENLPFFGKLLTLPSASKNPWGKGDTSRVTPPFPFFFLFASNFCLSPRPEGLYGMGSSLEQAQGGHCSPFFFFPNREVGRSRFSSPPKIPPHGSVVRGGHFFPSRWHKIPGCSGPFFPFWKPFFYVALFLPFSLNGVLLFFLSARRGHGPRPSGWQTFFSWRGGGRLKDRHFPPLSPPFWPFRGGKLILKLGGFLSPCGYFALFWGGGTRGEAEPFSSSLSEGSDWAPIRFLFLSPPLFPGRPEGGGGFSLFSPLKVVLFFGFFSMLCWDRPRSFRRGGASVVGVLPFLV